MWSYLRRLWGRKEPIAAMPVYLAPSNAELEIKRQAMAARVRGRHSDMQRDYDEAVANGMTHKRWVSSRDSSTRTDHRIADGQQVPIDQPFRIGGDHLHLPSDPSAPLDQTANCRCTVRYFRVDPIDLPLEEPDQGLLDAGPSPFFQTVADSRGRFLIDLRDHEGGRHRGHAIRRHVGKSRSQITRIMQKPLHRGPSADFYIPRYSSFTSLEAANKLVSATLAANSVVLDVNIASKSKGRRAFDHFFGSKTGTEGYRQRRAKIGRGRTPDPVLFRDTFGARVVLRFDHSAPLGFWIISAFPINEENGCYGADGCVLPNLETVSQSASVGITG